LAGWNLADRNGLSKVWIIGRGVSEPCDTGFNRLDPAHNVGNRLLSSIGDSAALVAMLREYRTLDPKK
jgi:hypothetical protein